MAVNQPQSLHLKPAADLEALLKSVKSAQQQPAAELARHRLLGCCCECAAGHDPVLLLGALHVYNGTCAAWPAQHDQSHSTGEAVCPEGSISSCRP